MKITKKLTALLMAAIMAFTTASCGSSESEPQELNVFVMSPDMYMESFLASYTGENGNITTNVEIGLSNIDMDTGDILKLLNTKLMSNDGPDIIILDDINPKGYIESGQLADLSDIVKDNKDLIGGVAESGKSGKGIYYIPASFSFITETKKAGADIDFTDMESFISSMKAGGYMSGAYENQAVLWYRTEIEPQIREKKKVTEEEVTGYFEKLNAMTDLFSWEERGMKKVSLYAGNFQINPLSEFDRIHFGKFDAARDYTEGIGTLQRLYSMAADGDISFEYTKKDGENIYIPRCIIAVNENSKNKKAAMKMVEYMLSDEGQRDVVENGGYFPVSRKIIEEELEAFGEEDFYTDGGHHHVKAFSEGAKEEIMAAVDNLKYESYSDVYLMEIILSGAMDYINGNETLENAVTKTVSKANIYLAE